jgi:hypothetical protein
VPQLVLVEPRLADGLRGPVEVAPTEVAHPQVATLGRQEDQVVGDDLPATCSSSPSISNFGTGSHRVWCDFGVPSRIRPLISATAWLTSIRPRLRSTLCTRSAATSSQRSPQ